MIQEESKNTSNVAEESRFSKWLSRQLQIDNIFNKIGYLIITLYSVVALYPIVLVFINSAKDRNEIFNSPYSLPFPPDFGGYETAFLRANFERYFVNSIVIVVIVLFVVLLIGSMAAHALAEYRFRGNAFLNLFFAVGIMIPIRLGTVSFVRMMRDLELQGTIIPLLIIYTAMGLPITVFVLQGFMQEIPRDLKDAARVDGASEYRIFFTLVLPLIRPAIATVAVFHMIPVWNDLWWPLILANEESTRTITVGVSAFIGQFLTDYPALLAALSLGMLPILIIYALFARQLIRGLSAGAVKA